jgi:Asp-tRNA(Asn)/Glu-tRNA(Gln) amidotransferase A subunit family amidase
VRILSSTALSSADNTQLGCAGHLLLQDNICTSGLRTTAGSKVLDSYLPPFDATTVAKLRAAGAVLIGKTNMDEFGMGSTTENSAYKVGYALVS